MRAPDAALLAFCIICLVAVAGPEYAGVGNRIEPRILGVPFSLMWNLGWVGASFVALGVYHWVSGGERPE